jgi:hypothetical protein
MVYTPETTSCRNGCGRWGARFGGASLSRLLLALQVRQPLLHRLHLVLEVLQILFQLGDLLRLGLVPALEASFARSPAATAAPASAALAALTTTTVLARALVRLSHENHLPVPSDHQAAEQVTADARLYSPLSPSIAVDWNAANRQEPVRRRTARPGGHQRLPGVARRVLHAAVRAACVAVDYDHLHPSDDEFEEQVER